MIRDFGSGELFYVLLAARWTIALSLAAIAGGGVLGLLIMTLRVVPYRPINLLAVGYIQVIQGTPLLGQLFVIYFGISVFGYDVGAWSAAVVAFSIYASAFLGEIWRGCVQAIPRTQWEASASLGLSFVEQLRYIIVPQAFRIGIPPTIGFFVHLVKNTSLASAIGFIELTRAGQIINAATFKPMIVYSVVAAAYFVICFSLSQISLRLEKRLHVAR
ncbi:MAG: amino acid ABC transporter permease [Gammaproteobacteria bacterium]